MKSHVIVGFLCGLCACGDSVELNSGETSAFISAHLALDEACRPNMDATMGLGRWDVMPGDARICQNAYNMHLLVDVDSKEIGVFDEAHITLEHEDGTRFEFSEIDTLPNPYTLLVAGRTLLEAGSGVVSLAAISNKYASQLAKAKDDNIAIEVRLTGKTRTGRVIQSNPFRFPIALCRGCLSFCGSNFQNSEGVQLTEHQCSDDTQTAADGRACVDFGC